MPELMMVLENACDWNMGLIKCRNCARMYDGFGKCM